MHKTKTFAAKIENLYEMLYWIRTEAASVGFDRAHLNQLEIAAEEAVVNIIRHAYQGKEGEVAISIEGIPHKEVKVSITDRGEAFNPLEERQTVSLNTSLEEREIGGLGILFIRECVDNASYRRENEKNILTLIKRLSVSG